MASRSASESEIAHLDDAGNLVGERLAHQLDDGVDRLLDAPFPVALEGANGLIEHRFPALIDGLQRAQQRDALGIGGAMGIELAHRVKGLVQGVLPRRHVLVDRAQVVQDGHAWAPGQAQQFHLGAVLLLDALGAVHHQDDAGPFRDRAQQRAVVTEQGIVGVSREEGTGQVAFVGMGLKPLQDVAGILEAWRIDKGHDRAAVDDHRVFVGGRGGARALVDIDAVVLGEGRDHRRLAGVGMAHDGQYRDLFVLLRRHHSVSSAGPANISRRR